MRQSSIVNKKIINYSRKKNILPHIWGHYFGVAVDVNYTMEIWLLTWHKFITDFISHMFQSAGILCKNNLNYWLQKQTRTVALQTYHHQIVTPGHVMGQRLKTTGFYDI